MKKEQESIYLEVERQHEVRKRYPLSMSVLIVSRSSQVSNKKSKSSFLPFPTEFHGLEAWKTKQPSRLDTSKTFQHDCPSGRDRRQEDGISDK